MDAKPIEPEVVPPPAAGARAARGQEILTELLQRLGVTAEIQSREAGDEVALRVRVVSGGEPVGLADPKAPLWEPLGYLVGKMVNRDPSRRCWLFLETGAEGAAGVVGAAALEERDEDLLRLGRFLAERAKLLGKVLAVGPMGSRERRSVHLAVKEVEGVTSRSEGEGASRRLLVVPDKLAPPPPGPEGA